MSNEMPGELEREALELLPWYVNGTLEGDERDLVRSQLLASLTCRKEFERLRRLQELMRHDNAETVAADRAFESLMARIRAHEAAPARPPGRLQSTRFAVAASLVAVTTALAWLWSGTPFTTPGPYETLTASQAGATVRLRVVFEPGVGEAERQALLAHHRLTPVGAPTAEGVYTLAFPEGADPAAIASALRADPRVRLATSPPSTGAP